jgi:hypothetical protein
MTADVCACMSDDEVAPIRKTSLRLPSAEFSTVPPHRLKFARRVAQRAVALEGCMGN